MNLGFLKELAESGSNLMSEAQNTVSKISDTVSNVSDSVSGFFSKDTKEETKEDLELVETEEVSEEEQEEKGSKMLQVMDWAFEKANGDIPGFGTSHDMAQEYLQKYGSVNMAIDKLINWQITQAATTGFVTSLGGLATLPFTLPANIAGVMAIQLRMIGAIAELGGFHENTEEKKTGMYLCLLGAQAGDVLSKTASQFAVKFAMASLKKLPGSVLTKINQRIGFRLLTKFGEKGLINIHKLIPILGGIVGGTIDALSTYAIAQAAKALFLDEIIEYEKQEQLEVSKVHLLLNLAQVDTHYDEEEKFLVKSIISGLNISPKVADKLQQEADRPKRFEVDFEPFKKDFMLSSSTLSALIQVASIGGISPVERIYITQVAKEMGCSDEIINMMFQQTTLAIES